MKPPETFDTTAIQYLKYRRRSRIAIWVFFVTYISLIPVSLEIGSLTGPKATSPYSWSLIPLGAIIVVSLWLRRRYKNLANEALPTIEGKTRVFQQLALKSLAAFIENGGKSFKKTCLKNLRTTANFIDDWSVGNLQFLQRQFDDKMKEFKTGFRLRLIPAIEKAEANSDPAKEICQWLAISVQNELLSGFDGVRLGAWNNFLSKFAATKPGGMWRRLGSRTVMYHVAYLVSVTIVVYTYFEFQRNIIGADVNTATNGMNVVLTILLAPYSVYLFTKYQGRKASKTQ